MRRILAPAVVLVLALGTFLTQPAGAAKAAGSFQLVGHDPLYSRGMNAAPAMYRHWLYVGSRTDGTHPHAGVLVVDVATPSTPKVVNEIGPPDEGLPTSTSRELRVWPQQKLLIVMNFQCSAILHACASPADAAGSQLSSFNFFDLTDPANPRLVSTYTPSRTPHEMFLWVDPAHAGRALLYFTTPTSSDTAPNLIVADISGARRGSFAEILKWNPNTQFPRAFRDDNDVRLHSLALTPNGRRAYLAYLGGGFMVVDTSQLADGVAHPTVRPLNTPGDPSWGNPGMHSSVKVPGTHYAFATDEVYGDLLDPVTGYDHGCPWGWVRILDVADEAHPRVVSEYRTAENRPDYCTSGGAGTTASVSSFAMICDIPTDAQLAALEAAAGGGQDPLNTYFTSYSSHNPTVLPDLAFVTWHSNGLQAIDLGDPLHPRPVASFSPQPLAAVVTEDPALSTGESKVVAWSYPIIRNGLIYFVDVRNGLYVVRYHGPHEREVGSIGFYEGNSNLGDAARFGN